MANPQNHPNKQKFNQQYMNWFDNMKSNNSRYGEGWIERIDGVKIADGIFKLIPEFEKGKICFDHYPEAFSSNHFITNATPALDQRARELSISTISLTTALANNQVDARHIRLVNNRLNELQSEQNILNTVSSGLKSFSATQDRAAIDQMLKSVFILNKKKKLAEDQAMIAEMESVPQMWDDLQKRFIKRKDASRLVSQFTRPKFSVQDFVKGLKKDITIIPYIQENCSEEVSIINYIQTGIFQATDPLSRTYFNYLNQKKTAYEMILREFNSIQALLDQAYSAYQFTGTYQFPVSIEYNLAALQSKLIQGYRNML